ncbi:signal peptidase I [Hominifimenecus sp. rT4P-3]|uniref:signal peptidase I n=1 Tax=Hominifimenecus sp. rT4P-3 TaxID=3242979 RepID=UPI003DA2C794
MKKWLREFLPYFILLAVVLLIRVFILINATIPTESMENTIMADTRVMGLKCAYWFSEPERGDIIVFRAPDEPDSLYVKRVIGLPGDTVEVLEGVTYVNGEPLVEDYLPEPMSGSYGPYHVPEGHYFVMGDNRNHSLDARFWNNTYVSEEAISGKVYFSYWPKLKWIN